MKPTQIAFTIAALAGLLFFYEVNEITNLNEEAAALRAKIDSQINVGSIISSGIKSIVDGFTLGMFADEGIWTETKKWERLGTEFSVAAARLVSRYETAVFRRNGGFICGVIALVAGFYLKPKDASASAS